MRHPLRNPASRGFSMVELMVAMLIGLLGMIIIFQVFEVSEGIKRTTTSGGDAQQNGAIALYVMERDLRNGGMGFNDAPLAGCTILAYDSSRTTQNFNMLLAPVLICAAGSTAPGGMCPGTGTAGSTPDRLTVFYGSQPLIADATVLAGNWNNATAALQVSNTYAYRPGDMLVLLQPASGNNCSLLEITALPTTGPDAGRVLHQDAGTGYVLASGHNAVARFNQPGGPGVPGLYGGVGGPNVTRLFNLGNLYDPVAPGTAAPLPPGPDLPVYNTYAIVNNSLTVSSALVAGGGVPVVNPVADNIAQMRVAYGLDDGVNNGSVAYVPAYTACDGVVDRFVDAATFNALPAVPPLPNCVAPKTVWQTKWESVIAVRVAVVARSALAEKPSGIDGTKCDATTDGTESPTPGPDLRPRWVGGLIDVSASGDPSPASPLYWKCYRYRVFETTVPLRNWIWRSS